MGWARSKRSIAIQVSDWSEGTAAAKRERKLERREKERHSAYKDKSSSDEASTGQSSGGETVKFEDSSLALFLDCSIAKSLDGGNSNSTRPPCVSWSRRYGL